MTPAEIDRAVAEKVMGWERNDGLRTWEWDDGGMVWHEWRPSTDIAQAFEVVGAIMENGVGFEIRTEPGMHTVGFWGGAEARHPSLPMAICLAAIRAMEGGG